MTDAERPGTWRRALNRKRCKITFLISSPRRSFRTSLADAIRATLAGVLRASLFVTTALLPRNGRYHVRARALNRLVDGLEDVVIEGIRLRLQRRALVTGRPLDGLEAKRGQSDGLPSLSEMAKPSGTSARTSAFTRYGRRVGIPGRKSSPSSHTHRHLRYSAIML